MHWKTQKEVIEVREWVSMKIKEVLDEAERKISRIPERDTWRY